MVWSEDMIVDLAQGPPSATMSLDGFRSEDTGMWEDLTSVLEGKVVRLEPLGRRHEEGLFEAAKDGRIWPPPRPARRALSPPWMCKLGGLSGAHGTLLYDPNIGCWRSGGLGSLPPIGGPVRTSRRSC